MKNSQPDNILLDLFTEEAAETMGIRQGGGLTAGRPAELTFIILAGGYSSTKFTA